jgi:uncharacterized protein (TIGR00251 family)
MVAMLELTERDGWITFAVRVQPRASRTEIVGVHNGALKVRVAAPPVDGAANEELVRGLAKLLQIPAREIELVRGQTGRLKHLRIPTRYAPVLRRQSPTSAGDTN